MVFARTSLDQVDALTREAVQEIRIMNSPGAQELLHTEPAFRLEERPDSGGEPAYFVYLEARPTQDYGKLVELERVLTERLRQKLRDRGDESYAYLAIGHSVQHVPNPRIGD